MSGVEAEARPAAAATEDAAARRLRDEIAAATLILNSLGILGYSGHLSARLPARDAFLIQPFDQSRASITPADLLVCDLSGAKIEGPAGVKPPSEVYIHSEILRARPDINAVAHFHHERTTVFTLVEGARLAPIKNHAVRWADGIPVHPDPSHVSTPELGRKLAGTLGSHHALLIRAHGQVVTAESVKAVLIDSIHFVENAEVMYEASALGKPIPLSEAEIGDFLRDFDRARHIAKLWKYYVGRGRDSGLLPPEWKL